MNFDNLYNLYNYCQFKDLEGIYCDACRKWIVYNELTPNKEFYIVSDKLIACPDCVAVRNGNYPYLSDFSQIRAGFVKKCKSKKDILDMFRTPFNNKFMREDVQGRIVLGYEISTMKDRLGDLLVVKNKFKHLPRLLIETKYRLETVGLYRQLRLITNINSHLVTTLKTINKFQHERPVMKFIVTSKFGTEDQKKKLYNKYIEQDLILKECVDFNAFYENDFGLYYIMGLEEQVFNDSILDSVDNKNEIKFLLIVYDESLDWSERAQASLKLRWYNIKRFNVQKLGYY